MSGIVVAGATFVDIKGFPERAYIPTGRNVGRVEYVHGGVTRNVSEDIANVGIKSTFLSVVDNTGLGKEVVERLSEKGVCTDYISKKDQGMGTWLVVFDENGDVAGSVSQRPDLGQIDDVLDKHGDEIFADCDSMIIEMDMIESTVSKMIDYAKKYNKKAFGIVSNIGLVLQRREYVQELECFVCNQQEASMFFTKEIEHLNMADLEVAIKDAIIAANIKSMVVTAGAEGAVWATRDGKSGFIPARKVNVKDTTGAGDSFCAGVSVGLTYGKSLAEAVEIGTKLAASVIVTKENVCPFFEPKELGIEL